MVEGSRYRVYGILFQVYDWVFFLLKNFFGGFCRIVLIVCGYLDVFGMISTGCANGSEKWLIISGKWPVIKKVLHWVRKKLEVEENQAEGEGVL